MNQNHSDTIGEVTAALVEAQAVMPAVQKLREGQARAAKYKYATLDAILDAIRPVLALHKLGVTQESMPISDGYVRVRTVVRHASGEWIADDGIVLPAGDTPQTYGSAISYARRYGIQALLGISTEDDTDASTVARKRAKAAKDQPVAPPAGPPADPNLKKMLEARINELPETIREQVRDRVKKARIGWRTLSEANAEKVAGWVDEAEEAAEAELVSA